MVTLDDLLNADPRPAARRGAADAGRQTLKLAGAALYGVGWLLAKAVLLTLLALGGALFGVGWTARRVIWPALVWMGAAVRLGWEEGRSPGEGGGRESR